METPEYISKPISTENCRLQPNLLLEKGGNVGREGGKEYHSEFSILIQIQEKKYWFWMAPSLNLNWVKKVSTDAKKDHFENSPCLALWYSIIIFLLWSKPITAIALLSCPLLNSTPLQPMPLLSVFSPSSFRLCFSLSPSPRLYSVSPSVSPPPPPPSYSISPSVPLPPPPPPTLLSLRRDGSRSSGRRSGADFAVHDVLRRTGLHKVQPLLPLRHLHRLRHRRIQMPSMWWVRMKQ